jgi:hypothetical protein
MLTNKKSLNPKRFLWLGRLKGLKPRKFAVSAIIVLLAIILGLGSYSLYLHYTKITVKGKVFDASSGKTIIDNGLTLKSNGQEAKVNAEGIYELKKVPRFDVIEVTGGQLFSPAKISVNNRKKIDIYLQYGLYSILDPFFKYAQNRQYRRLYETMHPQIQEKVTEDDFLKTFNQWRDDLTKKGYTLDSLDYALLENQTDFNSSITDSKFFNTVELAVNWHFDKDRTIQTRTYFMKEGDRWYWLWDKSFLPEKL